MGHYYINANSINFPFGIGGDHMIKRIKYFNYATELYSRLADLFTILSGISYLKDICIYIVHQDNQFIRVFNDTITPEVIQVNEVEDLEEGYKCKKTYFDGDLIAILFYKVDISDGDFNKEENIKRYIDKIEGFILNAVVEIYNKLQGEIQLTFIYLLRGLNRQFSKEKSIELVLKFIKDQLEYETVYVEVNEDKRIFIPQYATELKKLVDGGINVPTQMPVGFYREMQYINIPETIKQHFPRLKMALDMKAVISMPIFIQDKITGLLVVYDKVSNRIDQGILNIVKEIAGELTVLFSRIDRQNLNLEKMLSLTALENLLLYPVDENVNIDEFLHRILSVLPTVTGMKNCTIAPIDEKGVNILIQYTTNNKIKEAGLRQVSIPQDKVTEHVIESKKPVIVYDSLSDPRCNHKLMTELRMFSYIALPVSNIHGKVLGILFLDNGEYQTFTKEQIRFFEVISKHIGLMISNAVYIEELFIKSRYDGLTGLYNRETFELLYTKLYDNYRYEDKKFSVLMLDIDDFKEVNDHYGHQLGDIILRKVADAIMKSVRKEDIVARYGGEEIIILLKDNDAEGAKIIAERIRSTVASIEVKKVKVTVSIGVSTFRTDSHDKTKLISIADACLYEAKRAGKNYVKTLDERTS